LEEEVFKENYFRRELLKGKVSNLGGRKAPRKGLFGGVSKD